jgi:hypothetical protein
MQNSDLDETLRVLRSEVDDSRNPVLAIPLCLLQPAAWLTSHSASATNTIAAHSSLPTNHKVNPALLTTNSN